MNRSSRGAAGRRSAGIVSMALATGLTQLLVAPSLLAAPVVQLVETVPVETKLGNPALPAAHDVWIEMIRGARTSLDLEQFYLSNWPGEPLQDVLDAIADAARRGVKVRLILDAGMHRTYPQPADSLATLPGWQVRLIDMKKIAGGVQHAKYFLVDDREVYLGSQNFDWRALKHIHELGVRVRDAGVTSVYRRVFDMDWNAATDVGTSIAGSDSIESGAKKKGIARYSRPELPFRLVQAPGDTVLLWPSYTPRGFIPDSTLWDEDALVRLLASARREIALQVYSYGTSERGLSDDTLDRALRGAAARGVRVKLLIADWQKGRESMSALQDIVKVGGVEAKLGTVPEWTVAYIPFARVEHCKYLVVDSLSTWIGTDNWEPGYFHRSRNVAVTLRNRPLALQARQIFETSWRSPLAEPVQPGKRYESKVHGETPPPGRKKYGG